MSNAILVINAGSSSIKFSLFAHASKNDELKLVYRGAITGIGTHAHFTAKDVNGEPLASQDLSGADHGQAFSVLLDWLEHLDDGLHLAAVGHRVVHGGLKFNTPVQVNDSILAELDTLIPLAPLHQPHNLSPIRALAKLKGELPQVACFDTAFHTTQPNIACLFALPRNLSEQGIRRYGFHGLSYEYIAQCLPEVVGQLPSRVVVAHLGNGSSMAALKDGRSLATTMGFTALDGLPMGTRCGTLDAGVVLHLLNNGMDAKTVSNILYHQSGLLGVSGGISNDMADLLASDAPEAKEAVDLFVYRICRELGSLSAALGGLDALVFTAGIGENAKPVREMVCRQSEWLGIHFDANANAQGASRISQPNSPVSVWVIPTNEEMMIAQHTLNVLGK